MTITVISPAEARSLLDAGALLLDVRDGDEHARERISGASNVPMARLGDLPVAERPIVFHCRTGMRTSANASLLAGAAQGAPAYILDGGIEAWRRAGYATVISRSQPIEIMRQVQITAGGLVLAGVLLGIFVAPAFLALSGFVGAGLMFAGVSGWCGMARLLHFMPWNRRAAGSAA